MIKDFLPYYISRAIISSVFSILLMGFTWQALLLGIVLFGLFVLYLHSGWFSVDENRPLAPLRRDHRGQEIQRKAIIAALILGFLIYLFSSQLTGLIGLSVSGNVAFAVGIITYFATQFVLFTRA